MTLLREVLRRFDRRMLRSPGTCVRYGTKLFTARGRAELRGLMGLAQAKGAPPVPYCDPFPNLMPPPLREVPGQRRLSVFLPSLQMRHMSGGPNTAILLALRLHDACKIPLRFVSTDMPLESDATLHRHFEELTETDLPRKDITSVAIADRNLPFELGSEEVILATAWWTAQPAHRILARTKRPRPYLYLVQEFEPGLYPWSSEYALAEETYAHDIRPIVNEQTVLDFLVERRQGRFAEADFVRDHCVAFEPALDVRKFHPGDVGTRPGKKRLLFYARPTAPRNLYQLGLAALKDAIEADAFPLAEWEICFMGEKIPDLELGKGHVIRTLPWQSFDGYAANLRACDAGLSLMLSPHTSYPPLEMAACGVPCVTTSYATKTAQRLVEVSPNLIPAIPDRGHLAFALREAWVRSQDLERRKKDAHVSWPRSWNAAFDPILPRIVKTIRAIGGW